MAARAGATCSPLNPTDRFSASLAAVTRSLRSARSSSETSRRGAGLSVAEGALEAVSRTVSFVRMGIAPL
jgi:hypothetical protein